MLAARQAPQLVGFFTESAGLAPLGHPCRTAYCDAVLIFSGPVPVDHLAWANLIAGCSGYLDRLSLVSK